MSQERRGSDEMREEYEFAPGSGVRGKYYDRYRQSVSPAITAAKSQFVSTTSTAARHRVPSITIRVSYPVHLPSPKLQIPSFPSVHAG
jgi:hypothetical protein